MEKMEFLIIWRVFTTIRLQAHLVLTEMIFFYVVGSEYDGTKHVAKVWKNGITTIERIKNYLCTRYFLSICDVYVCGRVY
jgi:hypothetical protein